MAGAPDSEGLRVRNRAWHRTERVTDPVRPLEERIREAFASVEYPGDWCLRGSNEGEEPYLLEKEFRGKTDRWALDAAFLDQAPDGYGTALHFFSDEAFRFYLPAYLIADLAGGLERADPVFSLTHGLDDRRRGGLVNERRYGARTWWDEARRRLSVFSPAQAAVIVEYLRARAEALGRDDHPEVEQAIAAYWAPRAAGRSV